MCFTSQPRRGESSMHDKGHTMSLGAGEPMKGTAHAPTSCPSLNLQVQAASQEQLKAARFEIAVMSRLRHPNLLPLLASHVGPAPAGTQLTLDPERTLHACALRQSAYRLHCVRGDCCEHCAKAATLSCILVASRRQRRRHRWRCTACRLHAVSAVFGGLAGGPGAATRGRGAAAAGV